MALQSLQTSTSSLQTAAFRSFRHLCKRRCKLTRMMTKKRSLKIGCVFILFRNQQTDILKGHVFWAIAEYRDAGPYCWRQLSGVHDANPGTARRRFAANVPDNVRKYDNLFVYLINWFIRPYAHLRAAALDASHCRFPHFRRGRGRNTDYSRLLPDEWCWRD